MVSVDEKFNHTIDTQQTHAQYSYDTTYIITRSRIPGIRMS
jgi:hypothetical protein